MRCGGSIVDDQIGSLDHFIRDTHNKVGLMSSVIILLPASLFNLKLLREVPKRLEDIVHELTPPQSVPESLEQCLGVVPIFRVVAGILPVYYTLLSF